MTESMHIFIEAFFSKGADPGESRKFLFGEKSYHLKEYLKGEGINPSLIKQQIFGIIKSKKGNESIGTIFHLEVPRDCTDIIKALDRICEKRGKGYPRWDRFQIFLCSPCDKK